MKKIFSTMLIVFLVVVLCGSILIKRDIKNIRAQIYYIDHSMLRLIPVDINLGKVSKERAAKLMIEKLIEGKDENSKILRVIPDEKDCISVSVDKRTAVVNFNKVFIKNKPVNKTHGILMIYSIVNSLTSIDGIDTVKFYVDQKQQKDFIKGIDMREVFIPDYYM